jgi:hypothetical protein
MSLKNKVAIVTGGNSGIGQAIVLELARRDASTVIDYMAHPEATEALEQQVSWVANRSVSTPTSAAFNSVHINRHSTCRRRSRPSKGSLRHSFRGLFSGTRSCRKSGCLLPSFEKYAVRQQSICEEIHDRANAGGAPEIIVRKQPQGRTGLR